MYVVKMDGMKVRTFSGVPLEKVERWANLHCSGKVEIVSLYEYKGLPRASSRIYPNENLAPLVYKPFVAIG